MLTIHIKKDYYAYITTDNEQLMQLLKKSFIRKDKVYNNYYRMYETRNKVFYTMIDNGTCLKVKAGLISYLCASLDKNNIKYDLIDDRLKFKTKLKGIYQLDNKVELRDYQKQTVRAVLDNQFCCIQLPTSTGKTEVATSIIKSYLFSYYNDAVLYAVPTKKLQKEAEERFNNYGLKTNTKFPIQKNTVNVLTYAALIRADTEKFDYKQRNNVGVLIVDECHHLSADKLSKLVHRLHNLRMSVGLSATLSEDIDLCNKKYLKELKTKEFAVIGCTGKVVYHMDIDESIDKKFVTPIEVRVLVNRTKHKLGDDETDWQIIKNTILKDKDRAKRVAEYTKHIFNDANLDTIVLLIPEVEWSRIYMEQLNNIMQNSDVRLFEMYGGDIIYEYKQGNPVQLETKEEKQEAENAIRNSKVKTIFSATTFFFEGINITNIQAVINCYGGKDSKRVKQQAGRCMRLSENKEVAYIHEVKDVNNPVLESQFRKRINIYEKEYNAKVVYSTF